MENTMYLFGLFLLWIPPANGLEEAHVVYPRLLEERSSDGAMVMRVHDHLTLNLRKASVAAPELRVLTQEDGKTVTHMYNGEDIEKDLYEDEDKIATVAVTRDEKGVYMNGLVGPKHRIEPVPLAERSEHGAVPHKIYEIEHQEMLDTTLRHAKLDEKLVISERWNPQPTAVPAAVYIELFFVADGPHYKHFSSTEALLRYLCVMTNSTEPYAYLYPNNPYYMYDDGTLRKFRDYAYKNRAHYGYPDVVYLISGRDVYAVIDGKANVNGLGIGFVSSVCTASFVALGEDKPEFYTGMHTLTHELAHVLGSEHDGEAPKSAGHPGSLACSWDVGNIMSYIDRGPSHHQFSACSLRQMQYVLRKAGPICWQVRSKGYAVHDTYPGMLVSQLAYCKEVIQDNTATIESYSVVEKTCKVRCVFYKYQKVLHGAYNYNEKRRFYQEASALDYTYCAASKVCIQGICVVKPNEPFAATTKNYQSVPVKPTSSPLTTRTTVSSPQCPCDCNTAATLRPKAVHPRRPWPPYNNRVRNVS
ncbi:venom metalloproteinase antarease-like TtrivMP_A isoform X2 [Rhipicephalus sanguineus]|uniref:venom metalloproteinase antarease-like TtrivMP_A isoform X2 n=1 Tax=Rhipicephalus sanguineus TaxID=34632 RepID=UPI00189347AC|nr:venom metalloproteinase antarease-like TtrivMP_A isoform X2 [Rhipicephalus sanguineus]